MGLYWSVHWFGMLNHGFYHCYPVYADIQTQPANEHQILVGRVT